MKKCDVNMVFGEIWIISQNMSITNKHLAPGTGEGIPGSLAPFCNYLKMVLIFCKLFITTEPSNLTLTCWTSCVENILLRENDFHRKDCANIFHTTWHSILTQNKIRKYIILKNIEINCVENLNVPLHSWHHTNNWSNRAQHMSLADGKDRSS